jgi:hypothetical protein
MKLIYKQPPSNAVPLLCQNNKVGKKKRDPLKVRILEVRILAVRILAARILSRRGPLR